MGKLKLIRGIVTEAKVSTLTGVTKANGKDAEISSISTDYTDLWLTCDGKDIPVRVAVRVPFLAGHTVAIVQRGQTALYLCNETTGQSMFTERLFWWETFAFGASFLICILALLSMMLVGGGAPILHIVVPMIVCPIVVGIGIFRARSRLKGKVRALVAA